MFAKSCDQTELGKLALLIRQREQLEQLFYSRGIALLILSAVLAESASAQGPLRRFGDRIRENVQQPVVPPVAPPTPVAPAARQPGISALNAPSRSPVPRQPNYNPPQPTRPSAGVAPVADNRSTMTPSAATQASATSPVRQTALTGAKPRAKLGLIVENPAPKQVPGRVPKRIRGALITGTEPRSSAAAAGFAAGDLVVAIDGLLVGDVDELIFRLSNYQPSDRVEVKFIRNEKLSVKTVIMAGPDGQLSDADRAEMKPLAAQDVENDLPAPSTSDAKTDQPSTMEGLGRALGGWLGGGAGPVAPDKQKTPDYESLKPPLESPVDVGELLPAPTPSQESLLEEVERLRRRVKELESEKSASTKL